MMIENNARPVAKQSRAKADHSDEIIACETKRMLGDFIKSLVAVFVMWLFMWLLYLAFA